MELSAKTANPTPAVGSLQDIAAEIDRLYQSRLSRRTLGLSPAGLTEIYVSWLAHLIQCPGRLSALATYPLQTACGLAQQAGTAAPSLTPDPRFKSDEWAQYPWKSYVDMFHAAEGFWDLATRNIPGLSPQYERATTFVARQLLDAISPGNFLPTNPQVLKATFEQGGLNLLHGWFNLLEDVTHTLSGQPQPGMEQFVIGENIAVTPGKVVLRNQLMELIQYDPITPTVQKEPILILPAWIMKYYILDLSAHNSMVRWLTQQGHTVFIVSWKNPDASDRNNGMDDYLRDGALAALDAVSSIYPKTQINLAGYCLGGTLAMIAAAWLARQNDKRLKSLTLMAAQGDFTEAGEMMVFVTPSEVSYLENMMWSQGYLDTKQMAGAFQMLRSYDLIWSRITRDYMMGQRSKPFDLMAWNADATRMPYRMHSEYLDRLYLKNEFANGHFVALGQPVAPENITIPIFAIGTETDHVAPWKSVYKIHLMVNADVTFALTSGGHNAGIVSAPGQNNRHYRLATHKANAPYIAPSQWTEQAKLHNGSWWQAWDHWLKRLDSKTQVRAPRKAGNAKYPPHYAAPGQYIHQK